MADSDDMRSVETDHESDADDFQALRWTARRMEASDDDDDDDDGDADEVLHQEKVKEKYRWSSVRFFDDELDDLGGASEYDYQREGFIAEELLEEVSQEEREVQEPVRVNKGKEKVLNDEVFVPRSGSFYMHDDRFRSRRYGRRKHLQGSTIGKKLWDCKDEQKWKHDKFEDMMDISALESFHQQQRNNRNKGNRYTYRKQLGSHDNFANQKMTSRIVRGRGPVKYKPIVKGYKINPSSKHQIHAKLEDNTSRSGYPRLPSHAFAVSSDSCGPGMQQLISTTDSSLPESNSISSSHGNFLRWRSNYPILPSHAFGVSSDLCVPGMQQLISTMDSSLPESNSISSSHDNFLRWRSKWTVWQTQ